MADASRFAPHGCRDGVCVHGHVRRRYAHDSSAAHGCGYRPYTLSRRIGGNIGYAFVANQIVHRTTFHRARLVDHLTPYDVWTSQVVEGLTGRLASSGVPPGVAEDSALKLLAGAVHRAGDDVGLQ